MSSNVARLTSTIFYKGPLIKMVKNFKGQASVDNLKGVLITCDNNKEK